MVSISIALLGLSTVISSFFMLVCGSPMQLACSLVLFFAITSCLVSTIVHPWVGAILFLIYGGVILVAFVYVLAMDPAPQTKVSGWDWHHLKVVPIIFFVGITPLIFNGYYDFESFEVVILASPDGYFLPLFSPVNRKLLLITLACLAGTMSGALKLVPSHQGALRPLTGADFKRAGWTKDHFKDPKLRKEMSKIFWSL
uniref:NADH dehydrogenase subunit 6 n=1 Tax=Lingula anatina TaxID=7574 RepID=A0A0R7JKV5_LINAN|nr:NADH dehydrogenase subunit 6 [Lingula anatina]